MVNTAKKLVVSILYILPVLGFSSTPITSSPKSPTVSTSINISNSSWSNLSNLYTSNGAYAQITGNKFDKGISSDIIHLSGFGFNIPSNATITGITVEIERFTNTGKCKDQAIQLINASGVQGGDNKKITSLWANSDPNSYSTYGGTSDLWGSSWTYTDINSSNFGIAIQAKSRQNNSTVSIDHVQITVDYTIPSGPVAPSLGNGPGGIGSNDGSSNLALWLDANSLVNTSVSSWTDGSGHGNNANALSGSEPTLLTNANNGMASVLFDASNSQYLRVNDDATLKPNKISMFVVGEYSTNTSSWSPFVIKSNDWEWDNGYGICRDDKNSEILAYAGHYSNYGVKSNLSTGTNTMMSMVYDQSNVELFYNANSQGTVSYTSAISNSSNYLYIGASADAAGTGVQNQLDGEISEVIVINRDVTLVERIIIHNYLAAKYGLALGNNDFYVGDDSGYDYHVSGIGQATDGSSHELARGTGIVTISNPSNLGNDRYLFWGENSITATRTFSTSSDYQERLSSTWKVSKRKNLGKVTLSVDSLELDLSGKQSGVDLMLVVSNDGNFTTKTTYPLTYSEGNYTATNVTLGNGAFFTFEYQDLIVIDHLGYYNGAGTNAAPNSVDSKFKLLVKASANGSFNISNHAAVRELEIESNGTLSIDASISLIVNGVIINNGYLVAEENASIIQTNTGTNNNSGTGSYNIKRSGNNAEDSYNIWSSPIQQASITTIFPGTNPCDIWAFEGNTQSWKSDYAVGYATTCWGNPVTFTAADVIAGGDGIMNPSMGYFVPGATTVTREYVGEINNGDLTSPIVTTSLGNNVNWDDDDWNLIGNPYPSALNATSFWIENAINNPRITDALYFWDNGDTLAGYNHTADYASWNNSGGVESGNSNIQPLGFVASGQGFWVVANQNTDVVFNNSMRGSGNNQFFKTTAESEKHNAWFRLSTPSGYKNNILVGFNPQTTDAIDHGYDGHKLVGNGLVKLASLIGQEEFVIQSVAPINIGDTKTVPLLVFTSETGIHTFTEYRRENMPADMVIYLRDNVLGVDHDLSTSDYNMTLTANVNYDARFELVFKNFIAANNEGTGSKGTGNGNTDTTTVTGINDILSRPFTLSQNQNELSIENHQQQNGTLLVLDMTGKVILTKKINASSSTTSVNWNHLSTGGYIITINNAHTTLFTKQVVKH